MKAPLVRLLLLLQQLSSDGDAVFVGARPDHLARQWESGVESSRAGTAERAPEFTLRERLVLGTQRAER